MSGGPVRTFDHALAYVMHRDGGISYAAIAREMGVTREAVRSACERIAGTKRTTTTRIKREPEPARAAPLSIFTPWPSSVRPELGIARPERPQSAYSRAMAGME